MLSKLIDILLKFIALGCLIPIAILVLLFLLSFLYSLYSQVHSIT